MAKIQSFLTRLEVHNMITGRVDSRVCVLCAVHLHIMYMDVLALGIFWTWLLPSHHNHVIVCYAGGRLSGNVTRNMKGAYCISFFSISYWWLYGVRLRISLSRCLLGRQWSFLGGQVFIVKPEAGRSNNSDQTILI